MGSPAKALLVIGADPGYTGGLVGVDLDSLRPLRWVAADKEPLGWWRSSGLGHPADRIREALRYVIGDWGGDKLVVVEKQFIRAGEAGGGDQLRDEGMIAGAAAGLGCGVKTVTPQTWRAVTGTGTGAYKGNKAASVLFCAARLPALDLVPRGCRVAHIGLADAGAIALYGCTKVPR